MIGGVMSKHAKTVRVSGHRLIKDDHTPLPFLIKKKTNADNQYK